MRSMSQQKHCGDINLENKLLSNPYLRLATKKPGQMTGLSNFKDRGGAVDRAGTNLKSIHLNKKES